MSEKSFTEPETDVITNNGEQPVQGMLPIVDAQERAAALDPLRSFCVSAPAGSGKTELLIQRLLVLLARVSRPEQILAITFTRKAAAEMRARVIEALIAASEGKPCHGDHERVTRRLAEAVLIADRAGGWQLLRDNTRLNIKTIDSFCAGLTRQMPILSQLGGQLSATDNAMPYYEEAAGQLIEQLRRDDGVGNDLAALLLHFDNDWQRLSQRLVALLAQREQWQEYVGVRHSPEESERYLVATVEALVHSECQALHRLLATYESDLLELLQYAAANLELPVPSAFPEPKVEHLPAWQLLARVLLTREGNWRKTITVRDGFPAKDEQVADEWRSEGIAKRRKSQLLAVISELSTLEGLEAQIHEVELLPRVTSGEPAWQRVLEISRLLPMLWAQLLVVFAKHGVVDHSQIAQAALSALGPQEAPTDLALRLDYRIEHILVDEFQDTAVTQYDLMHRLTRGWGDYNEGNPQAPRTLFVVGDAMQSIYAFRGANVGLLLQAQAEGFNGVMLEPLVLRCNFRSDATLVRWVNETFVNAFPAINDASKSQVAFSAAAPVRPEHADARVTTSVFSGESAREAEVAFICECVASLQAAHPDQSIAVLGRSRSHLLPIVDAFRDRNIPYHAQDLQTLAQSPTAMDLLILCRVLANPADRIAWLALLRSPWCGLTLNDLLAVTNASPAGRYDGVRQFLNVASWPEGLSNDGRRRLQGLHASLTAAFALRERRALRVWVEQLWLSLRGPECLANLAQSDDAEQFFQLLEQAELEGLGLDVPWLTEQLAQRYVQAPLQVGAVQVMTMHKSKGLEFDTVFLPQLARVPRGDQRQMLLWDGITDDVGHRRFLLAADSHEKKETEPTVYNFLRRRRKSKTRLENTRLFYVGATRAAARLILTATLNEAEGGSEREGAVLKPPSASSLLSAIWPDVESQAAVTMMDAQAPFGDERVALETRANDVSQADVIPLHRIPVAYFPETDASMGPQDRSPLNGAGVADISDMNQPEREDNHHERVVGTVVHLAMEQLSRYSQLPERVSELERERWRHALQSQGLWGDALKTGLEKVCDAVNTTLASGEQQGPWVLSSHHAQAHSEWPLSMVDASGIARDIVVDRTFVDERSGIRWVIDYKNSQPKPGEAMPRFFEREAEKYTPQLRQYRDVLATIGSEPVHCALFFTALGRLYPLPSLNQP